ncbi:hypothetical protein BEWA_048740 [Theileria equi strain WA]|uniref:Uncharacterized protein n=1 Tax=Theileria equi strain WA TaxID=1537102 RepID=L1LAB2_THEEQ|nr:hypothetical protein BEWA_048740 [Theileria equi strain WA]EKX72407.1 hypothetical protein BEWA_048740 [Theileria equi strain WA]|eukprot:XP_004831859.1 hypothetical protein BEWA_048740 [Theileria equi strain WA]
MNESEIELDIDPGKCDQTEDIKCSHKEHTPLNSYDSYEYTFTKGSVQLKSLSYGDISDSLLVLQINVKVQYSYYVKRDPEKEIGSNTIFDEFASKNTSLDSQELEELLRDVYNNERVEYYDLGKKLREKLWPKNGICFNLASKLITDAKYTSDVTGIQVTVAKSTITGGYKRVRHTPTSAPFYIKELKGTNEQPITLDNGFPNELLAGFSVYYGKDDSEYGDPLLIILEVGKKLENIPGKYITSKNKDTTNWNVIRVKDSTIDEIELENILKNIEGNKCLYIDTLDVTLKSKLADITKELIINLEEARNMFGTYDSGDDKMIPYKRIISREYTSVAHADTFTSFTIKDIKVTSDVSVSGVPLPTSGSRLSKLRAFYNGSTIKDPLLIYILENGGNSMWIYRYSGDKTWVVPSGDTTPASDVDSDKITKLLEQYYTPNVVINLDICAPYNPEDNTLRFNVNKRNLKDSKYYGFTHTAPSARSFRVKSVCHGTTLSGLSSETPLKSIAAYYLGEGHTLGKLLMVELVSEEDKYSYYMRQNRDPTKWTALDRTEKLGDDELIQKLNELVVAYFPPPPDPIPPIPPATTDNTSTGGVETGKHSRSTRYYQVAGAAIVGTIIGISILCFVIWKFTPVSRMYIVNRDPLL